MQYSIGVSRTVVLYSLMFVLLYVFLQSPITLQIEIQSDVEAMVYLLSCCCRSLNSPSGESWYCCLCPVGHGQTYPALYFSLSLHAQPPVQTSSWSSKSVAQSRVDFIDSQWDCLKQWMSVNQHCPPTCAFITSHANPYTVVESSHTLYRA